MLRGHSVTKWPGPDAIQASVQFDLSKFGPNTARELMIELPSAVRRSVPKRQAEFVAGRSCAREALRQLGALHAEPVGMNADRSPQWPSGVLGSISHSDDFASAIVTRNPALLGIGLDIETKLSSAVTREICDSVLTPEEFNVFSTLPDGERGSYLAIVFSAKESVYKCLFPTTELVLDFQDLLIKLSTPRAGEFIYEVRLQVRDPRKVPTPGIGRYSVWPRRVQTCAWVTAAQCSRL